MATYGPAQLAGSFRTVRANTIQIAEDIPESKYGFVPAPGTQSVAALLKHIAIAPTLQEDMHHRGQLMLIERLLGIVPHLCTTGRTTAPRRAAR